MIIYKFPRAIRQALISSIFGDCSQMFKTEVVWDLSHLDEKFDEPDLTTLIGTEDQMFSNINYSKLVIWYTLENKCVFQSTASKYVIWIVDHECFNKCGSCDGTTSGVVTLAPMSLKHSLEIGLITHVDLLDAEFLTVEDE